MNESLQEKLLIEQYKKTKNAQFLSDLYQPYMALVFGVCLKYLKNRELAQDAVMDIFEKLAFDLLKYDTPDNFKTWLYVVTKNFCLMKLRKDGSESRALKKMSDEIMDSGFDLHPLDKETPDLIPSLEKCMGELKEQQRLSIELFYYKKLCYREIADKMKETEKSIKSFIQNGKRNLKICLEKIESSI